jgi:hypothetical protein
MRRESQFGHRSTLWSPVQKQSRQMARIGTFEAL